MQLPPVAQILAEMDRNEVTVLVERRGACELPEGTRLLFRHPAATPPDACPALLRTLCPFVAAAAPGIPGEEPEGYLVACPGRRGTVWRVQLARIPSSSEALPNPYRVPPAP